MRAQLTFHPIGNADSILVELADERLLLVDYCDTKGENSDPADKRCDLSAELQAVMRRRKRTDFDVVAFTHSDGDHVGGSEEFFWLEHAAKYQGEGRFKIQELWVPALFITESLEVKSSKVIQQEAQHRLKKGRGIRVFSQPGRLEGWLRNNGIDPASRAHLIQHAGECVEGFTPVSGQAQIFVHSPFSFHSDIDQQDCNNNSLVLHFTFFEGDSISRFMLGGDAEHEAWKCIVRKTEQKKRLDRLCWDGFKNSHHTSYTALSSEKGSGSTKPIDEVARLFEKYGQDRGIIISSSDIIPAEETKQPPHREAKAYYEKVVNGKNGKFYVTMEHPSKSAPKPLIVEVTPFGLRVPTWAAVADVAVVSKPSPRMGSGDADRSV